MISRIILWAAVVLLILVLARALIKGTIEFNAAGSGLKAKRSDEPFTFWTFFSFGLVAIGYMLWLLLR